jgi:hypothetical protein
MLIGCWLSMPVSRMIHKPFLSLLLPLFLLLAQQGAILHELGHFASDQRTQRAHLQQRQQPSPQQAPGTLCEKCVVFAHLSGALLPDVPAVDVPLLAFALASQVAFSRRNADIPAARSRGPPVIL